MKCVSRLRFLLPLRSASFLCFRSGLSFPFRLTFVLLSVRSALLLPSTLLSLRFRLPLFRFFPFGFSLPVSFLHSRFGFPRSLRFASSFPLRFRAALRFLLLRFPASFLPLSLPAFRSFGTSRRLSSPVFASHSSLSGFLRAQLFRFLPSRVFRFAFRFRFPLTLLRFPPLSLQSASLLFSSFLFSSRFDPIPENDTGSRR